MLSGFGFSGVVLKYKNYSMLKIIHVWPSMVALICNHSSLGVGDWENHGSNQTRQKVSEHPLQATRRT
jgi:hypothetical protein